MKKIPSLFKRSYEGNRKVYNEVVPGSEWVLNGEGTATRKWDGIAVMVKDGKVYRRFDAKKGRSIPEGFIPAQPEMDETTGHWPGWVSAEDSSGKLVMEGVKNWEGDLPDGTYECCGPKIGTRHGANPENLTRHILIPHGKDVITDIPLSFHGIKEYLKDKVIEGVVWHHPTGKMVKIKKNDFDY